ncbi:MAG: bifunctional glutamate N-acetyltransferase/amino-acid acetyltransferase ArgJ [Fimbriiglobus sp.]|nr:bifunctional glutamate N-acetyltransferase/amino-acid acetyltransferase ArgJ [Fimbriiglobus sp.]
MTDWPLPRGYRFAGVVTKLRSEPDRRDVAVIIADEPSAAAGVFTQNRVCAAPVQVSRQRVPSANARAIVICSGNANACTGEQGLRDAERMAEIVATELGCSPEQVLVASTGVIGRPLPMPILEAGIPKAVHTATATREGLIDAAHAILTTDTRIKVAVHELKLSGSTFTVAGFAKGAAMIGPNMATMLGFVLTDASVSPADLNRILKRAADQSFNCISVEGHTSTNDTVFALAHGGTPLTGNDLEAFAGAIDAVCGELSRKIAADAEGAEHLITIDVEGCRSDAEARTIAKAIAESALVKSAVYGADPNWGRVVSAAGYCGVPFDEKELSLWMGDMLLFRDGTPLPFDAPTASTYLKTNREVHFRLTLKSGHGRCRFYTSDLTPEYVKLNADYTT